MPRRGLRPFVENWEAVAGTAFLACDESNAARGHRAALFGPDRHETLLTRGFSGRLARGLRNRLALLLETMPSPLPYPVQSDLLSPLRREAIARDRIDLVSLWAGQGTPLLRYHRAADLFAALVRETTAVLESRGVGRTRTRARFQSRFSE